jgi:hypothetical protein
MVFAVGAVSVGDVGCAVRCTVVFAVGAVPVGDVGCAVRCTVVFAVGAVSVGDVGCAVRCTVVFAVGAVSVGDVGCAVRCTVVFAVGAVSVTGRTVKWFGVGAASWSKKRMESKGGVRVSSMVCWLQAQWLRSGGCTRGGVGAVVFAVGAVSYWSNKTCLRSK